VRALIAIALVALLGAAGLGYAWHLLGELPQARPATPVRASEAPAVEDGGARELERVEAREAAAEVAAEPAPAPAGLEDGGGAPLARDYAAIYAERSTDERRAAAERLAKTIAAAQAALGPAEREDLAPADSAEE